MGTYVHLPIQIAGQILEVETAADLPTICVPEGSIRYIKDTNELVIWDGTQWGFWLDSLEVNDLIVNNIALINAQVVEIGDNCLLLNNDVTGAPTEDACVEIERGDEPNAQLYWDETTDQWYHGTDGNLQPITQDAISTVKVEFTCDASAAVYDWVIMSQTVTGKVESVVNNNYDDLIVGVICDKPTSTTCNVMMLGRLDGFAGLTPGFRVFVDTGGTPSTSKPPTGAVQVLGLAISTTEMLVDVQRSKVVQS